MGRSKKYVEAPLPFEIKCHGIFVPYDASVLDKVLSNDEKDIEKVKDYLGRLMEPTKGNEDVLGVNNVQNGIIVLIPAKGDGSDEDAIRQVLDAYEGIGVQAMLADRYVYADGRYMQEPYKGFLVTLPSHEIETEIRRILDTYCHSWKANQDPKLGMLYYEGDLGGRNVTICLQHGDWQMAAGLSSGEMHYTREVRKYWKPILKGLEDDIRLWAGEHPGVAKKVFEA